MSEYMEFLHAFDLIKTALIKEQENRKDHPEIVYCAAVGHNEFQWVLNERKAVTEAVNSIRHGLGLPFVSESQILRCENQACGHYDYTSKYAIGAAQLALSRDVLTD